MSGKLGSCIARRDRACRWSGRAGGRCRSRRLRRKAQAAMMAMFDAWGAVDCERLRLAWVSQCVGYVLKRRVVRGRRGRRGVSLRRPDAVPF